MSSDRHIVKKLTGAELFSFDTGSQRETQITADDLKSYVGGDIAAPAIMPERGARRIKISQFPNAEFNMRPGDVVTGLQNGVNVNFSFEQIMAGVLAAVKSA
jgi:hypothetical protein